MIEEEEWSKEQEANRKPGQKHPTPSPVRDHHLRAPSRRLALLRGSNSLCGPRNDLLPLLHVLPSQRTLRATRTASSTRACCSSGPRAKWPRSGASSTACSSGRTPRRSAKTWASPSCVCCPMLWLFSPSWNQLTRVWRAERDAAQQVTERRGRQEGEGGGRSGEARGERGRGGRGARAHGPRVRGPRHRRALRTAECGVYYAQSLKLKAEECRCSRAAGVCEGRRTPCSRVFWRRV